PVLGPGAAVANGAVTVDISPLVPGSTATFAFRLVNNDHDTNTAVQLLTPGTLPALTVTASPQGNEGSPLNLAASFTDDPSTTQTAVIDWGDHASRTGEKRGTQLELRVCRSQFESRPLFLLPFSYFKQDLLPGTISSDVHQFNVYGPV